MMFGARARVGSFFIRIFLYCCFSCMRNEYKTRPTIGGFKLVRILYVYFGHFLSKLPNLFLFVKIGLDSFYFASYRYVVVLSSYIFRVYLFKKEIYYIHSICVCVKIQVFIFRHVVNQPHSSDFFIIFYMER